jgi:endonuclease YncB( thermonuclease family)
MSRGYTAVVAPGRGRDRRAGRPCPEGRPKPAGCGLKSGAGRVDLVVTSAGVPAVGTTSQREAMHRRPVALAPALALVAGLLTAVGPASPSAADSVHKTLRQRGTIVKVVDGDTVDVRLRSGKEKRVRLVGIDTPEVYNGTECGGPEASRSLKRLLPIGTRVRLVSDPTQDRVDRYGRILRYVIKVSNGKDMDAVQIRRGWARVYVYHHNPFKLVADYRAAQRDARSHNRGIWGAC